MLQVLQHVASRVHWIEKEREEQNQFGEWKLEPRRFSSWTRLVRLQARVWRRIYNMSSPKERIKRQELLPEEIKDA